MAKVVFEFDHRSTRWVPYVEGANDVLEAERAFTSVVTLCQGINPKPLYLPKKGRHKDRYNIVVFER